jgi:hypothetical protein
MPRRLKVTGATQKGFNSVPSVLNAGEYLEALLADRAKRKISETALLIGIARVSERLLNARTREVLEAYGVLHDRVSDMIESGRLTERTIPDDYHWLVETLAELSPRIDLALVSHNSSN